jgi:hypothetical protein
MYRVFLVVAMAGMLFMEGVAQTISTIPSWTMQKNNPVEIVATQSASMGDNAIIYQLRKPETSDKSVANWFTARIQSDLQKEKWKETIKGSMNETDNVVLYLTEVTDATQKKWYLLYMGYGFGKNQVRMARVTSTPDKDFFQTKGMQASKHFGQLAGPDMKGNANTVNQKTNPAPEKETVRTNTNTDTEISAAGKGVKSSEIHSVIMHLEYEAGMGGAIYPVYNAYILFKNGSIYKHPVVSPADLLVAASRQSEPKKWGSWKLDGTTLNINWPTEKPKYQNSEWKKSSYYTVRSAKKGEPLEGVFKTLTGGGNTALGGDVLVVASANISFAADGKFTLAKSAGVSSGRSVWENTNSKSADAGTYYLDEHTIELKYNNGKIERRFFFFYPDSKMHFGIGQSVYMPKK